MSNSYITYSACTQYFELLYQGAWIGKNDVLAQSLIIKRGPKALSTARMVWYGIDQRLPLLYANAVNGPYKMAYILKITVGAVGYLALLQTILSKKSTATLWVSWEGFLLNLAGFPLQSCHWQVYREQQAVCCGPSSQEVPSGHDLGTSLGGVWSCTPRLGLWTETSQRVTSYVWCH